MRDKRLCLSNDEKDLVLNMRMTENRLGAAVLLIFLKCKRYFPKSISEVPSSMVNEVALQLEINPNLIRKYDAGSRAARKHKNIIKSHLGFDQVSRDDWEAILRKTKSSTLELHDDALKEELQDLLKRNDYILTSRQEMDRLLKSVISRSHEIFYRKTNRKIRIASKHQIDKLLANKLDLTISEIKSEPGKVGVKSLEKEHKKLIVLKSLKLPVTLFEGTSRKALKRVAARLQSETLQEIKRHPDEQKYAIVAAFKAVREAEIIDNITDILISITHKLSTRAESKLDRQILKNVKKVKNKEAILAEMAQASVEHPKKSVEKIIYPIASKSTLSAIVKEFKKEKTYKDEKQSLMRNSYIFHYRKMIPIILSCLEFRSNNSSYRPTIKAIEYIKKYARSTATYFPEDDPPPIQGVIKKEWESFVLKKDKKVNRADYELALLVSLRGKLRCKEIWVDRAKKYCNPNDDLPKDFDQKEKMYFDKLNLERKSDLFCEQIKQEMSHSLETLNRNIPTNNLVTITNRKGKGLINIKKLQPVQEPKNLELLKRAIQKKWKSVSLLDILKETELRVNFTDRFKSYGKYVVTDQEELKKKLLLILYGLGTNIGLKRIAHGFEDIDHQELVYVKRKFFSSENIMNAISDISNTIFKVRKTSIWGEATTACASDARKFSSWNQNLLTEWHNRLGGNGIMVYWHVEKNSTCIHSQIKSCSSSEVAAMIQGVIHHNTVMEVDRNYVDTKGQSEVGFAFCHLLGFQLMPRLKDIKYQKLYLPEKGVKNNFQNLLPVLTRPINWELISNQYSEMVKHAAAIKMGYCDTESVLKRFTKNNLQHPTYLAFKELGKALKTIFLCEYIRLEELRREIHQGLNVIENWNSLNDFVFFGKSSEFSSNSIHEREQSVLAMHLLQNSLVLMNTIMIQEMLEKTKWISKMTREDFRGLNPLINTHINPYGAFDLDMRKRLLLAA